MLRNRWLSFGPVFVGLAVLFAAGLLYAQGTDPGTGETTTIVKKFGGAPLMPPTDAANQDARGAVHLRQVGERIAIHVLVKRLEPAAVYTVSAVRKEGDPLEAVLGDITTRDATPPLPTVFRAKLVLEEAAPPPPGGGNFWDFFHHHWDQPLGGFAVLVRSMDEKKLTYHIFVMGLKEGEKVDSVSLKIADPSLDLPLDDHGKGSVDITHDQLVALAGGEVVLAVKVGDKTLSGKVKACFSFWLEHMAKRLSGSGALKLDTERGDKIPFDITDIKTLVGVTFNVTEKKDLGALVLTGTVAEVKEFTIEVPVPPTDPPVGGGGSFVEPYDLEADVLQVAENDVFFDVGEAHDASIIRGDVNDDGYFDLSDPVSLLASLFLGARAPYCGDAADANDNGTVDLTDSIVMLQTLFLSAGSIAAPFPARGFDSTPDELFCGGR